jgi:hypothetical protein
MSLAILLLGAAPPLERASVAVVIQRAVRVGATDWKPDRNRRQRELIRVEDGRRVRLRLTEFE